MELVNKVSLTATFRGLKVGESATLSAAVAGSFLSARSAVYRLNAAGEGQYDLSTPDNGCTYTVKRTK